MPMWMYGYGWPAALWMIGGALFWLALLSAAVWLFARWLARATARLDAATTRAERARDELLQAHIVSAARMESEASGPPELTAAASAAAPAERLGHL